MWQQGPNAIDRIRPLQNVWIALRANERAILEEVTLGHIATGHLPDRVVELTDDPRPGPDPGPIG